MSQHIVSWSVLHEDTVVVDGRPVEMTGRSRAVLLRLLLDANRTVTIERLMESLWGDVPPKTGRNSIARFVADLRAPLGDLRERIVSGNGGYMVRVLPGELDAHRVEAALAGAQRVHLLSDTQLRAAAAQLHDALRLVGTGPNRLLEQLTDAWITERAHTELRISLLETFAETKMRLREYGELVGVLQVAVGVHPYHEELWRHLMSALAARGRPTEALRAGRRLRDVLKEVGVVPSASVVQAEQEILACMHSHASAVSTVGSDTVSVGARAVPDPGTS